MRHQASRQDRERIGGRARLSELQCRTQLTREKLSQGYSHDLLTTVKNDVFTTVENDVLTTVENDVLTTVENDVLTTAENDLIRRRLRSPPQHCDRTAGFVGRSVRLRCVLLG